jgi:hypothetical protein
MAAVAAVRLALGFVLGAYKESIGRTAIQVAQVLGVVQPSSPKPKH